MNLRKWQKAFMVVSLGAFALSLCMGVAHAGVLGYWAMDDANYPPGYFEPPARMTPDGSGNGNAGVLSDALSVGEATGFDGVGKSANFAVDPVAAIDCGMDPSIKPTSAGYSFATWVKFNDFAAAWQLLGSDWNDAGTPGEKFFYHFGAQGDEVTLYLGEPDGDGLALYGTTPTLTTDTWMHLGFTVTPGNGLVPGEVKLYMNGTQIGATTDYNYMSLPYTSEPVILGAKTVDGTFPLRGQLDATGIWTSALSDTDFQALAGGTSPLSVSTPTLGGFWDYEDPVPTFIPPTATVLDSSSNGYDGVMTPDGVDPFHPTSGRFGGAVRLTGTEGSNINVGDIDGTTQAMTFSTWIKPDDLDGLQIVASQSDDDNMPEWAWQIFINGGNANLYVHNPEWDGTGNSFIFAGAAEGITTDWNHLVMTMEANDGAETGEVALYLNGELAATMEYDTDMLLDSSADIVLGNKDNVYVPFAFRGMMDDTIFLDTVLSPTQIAFLYENPGSLVPEPSSAVLFLGAVLTGLFFIRKKLS